jgi:hypothetical protein
MGKRKAARGEGEYPAPVGAKRPYREWPGALENDGRGPQWRYRTRWLQLTDLEDL